MKVEIGNAQFLISWLHYNGTIPEGSKTQAKKAVRQTVCDIVFPNGEVFSGVSICSKKDNFCKETGRKISLTRALVNAGFVQSARKTVWEEYFHRKGILDYVPINTKGYGGVENRE